ncbi:MAG: ATP-binding protein [Ginsengibacter sp.]
MLAEPFIIFFLLRSARRMLRNDSITDSWDRPITFLLYATVILFAAEIIFHLDYITKWIWHAALIGIICVALLKRQFFGTRTLMYAILPFAILSFLSDIFKFISERQYHVVDNYLDAAVVFSIVWMIAMILVSGKQRKVLKQEREKTQQQEEQKRWMETRKEELEKIVAERTAELRQQKEQVETTLEELKATQAQLIQSEKMASLGELTAGIAHEIQNPLNFVNNFSEVNSELILEMKNEIDNGNLEDVKEIANNIAENEEKIVFHGKRADAIVKGMLQHSRNSSSTKELTDINSLADEYLRLAYHGLRAKDKSFNATMKTDFDESIGKIDIFPQDMGRVILNLITNAFYAVTEKKKRMDENTSASQPAYEPTVSICTRKLNGNVEIRVSDNGDGISQHVIDKIFQPFFTTKPTGQGTGLGLSMSYDIVTKGHNGELKVETKDGYGSTFIIKLPV